MSVKKPNRAARMKKKSEHADTFNKGFDMGYQMGYEQAKKDINAVSASVKVEDLQQRYYWY